LGKQRGCRRKVGQNSRPVRLGVWKIANLGRTLRKFWLRATALICKRCTCESCPRPIRSHVEYYISHEYFGYAAKEMRLGPARTKSRSCSNADEPSRIFTRSLRASAPVMGTRDIRTRTSICSAYSPRVMNAGPQFFWPKSVRPQRRPIAERGNLGFPE
jgi:hypothetical protein